MEAPAVHTTPGHCVCWVRSEGVVIDFGHTSLLLKIPWLLLFCCLSPSFCLACSNETPNELEHVLTVLSLPLSLLALSLSSFFSRLVIVSLPRSSPADFSIAPFPPPPSPSFCLHLTLPCALSLSSLCAHFILLSLFIFLVHLISPFSSSPRVFSSPMRRSMCSGDVAYEQQLNLFVFSSDSDTWPTKTGC